MMSRSILLVSLAGLLFASQVSSFSLNSAEFERLVAKSCFNRSKSTGKELILGQNEPIGVSIENLISQIEKFEQLNPTLKPADVIRLFLKRFRFDGVWFNGKDNVQSSTEYKHAILTTVILSSTSEHSVEPTVEDFPESQFSDDEKCNLFFSITHGVNETALEQEEESNTHLSEPYQPARAPERDMGTEVPLKTEMLTTLRAEQSEFLADSADRPSQKRNKRDIKYFKQVRLTKTPREIGVVSFLDSKNNPVSVNKVLLGLLVGLAQVQPQKMSEILKKAGGLNLPPEYEDEILDPVLAVTLGDLYGIDTDKGIAGKDNDIIFGADGEWNDTLCHTKFILKSEGKWGTMAEFRGGLDGYNIGRELQSSSFLEIYPNIAASQVLRFYYTKQGLNSQTSVCNRGNYIDGDLRDDLVKEATKYMKLWNIFHRLNQHSSDKIDAYIKNMQDHIFTVLKKAALLNQEELSMCSVQTTDDIKSQVCESSADVFFMLDATQRCTLGQRCNQALFVNRLARQLRLGQQLGSVSVVFNAKGVDNPAVVDQQRRPISTPLYAIVYNSTSSECAACKASNFDPTSKDIIRNRIELLQQINLLISNYDGKQKNSSAIPAKLFYWFDYGTLQPIPSDKVQQVQYEQKRRELLATQRDVTFFGIVNNATTLKDIILENQNIVAVDFNLYPQNQIEQLASRMCQVPSVFQYNDCAARPSQNYVNQGWITPGYKQYWAMYPDYFLKSFGIELKFRADDVLLQVCYSRSPNPEQDSKNCKTNRNVKDEIVFVVNNPCKGFTYDRCPPMYFTVGTTGQYSPKFCNGLTCQNSNQVQWYFTHTGISCNRCTTLSISVFLLVISSIISLFTS